MPDESNKTKQAQTGEIPQKEEQKPEVKTPTEALPEEKPQPAPKPPGQWFVVHTYSGHENKAAEALKQRIKTMNLTSNVFDVVVPTRNIVVVRHGKKEETKEKIFPGYILVNMNLNDETWLAVRTTPGVTAFVGVGNKPTPISDKEVDAILKFTQLAAPKFKTKFSKGEAVKIIDGPFVDFLGTVDVIDEDKGKVKILVSIFGRETPVELDFLQVAKL
ncbi:transcription termination/antitermination factor NusG [Candidatus Gottesmanbacteria bacterium]|nr:transcription termination/antitermination factor NusG [Candidatus Gottesmanbacteria bacterium]